MKRKSTVVLSVLLALAMGLSLTACFGGGQKTSDENTVKASSIAAGALDVTTTLSGYALTDTEEKDTKTVYAIDLFVYVAETRSGADKYMHLDTSDFTMGSGDQVPSSIRLVNYSYYYGGSNHGAIYYIPAPDGIIYDEYIETDIAQSVEELVTNEDGHYSPKSTLTTEEPGEGDAGDAYVDTTVTRYQANTSVSIMVDRNSYLKIMLEFDEPLTGMLSCKAKGKDVDEYGPASDFGTRLYNSDDYVGGLLQMCVPGGIDSMYEIKYGTTVKTYGAKVNETSTEKAVYFDLTGVTLSGGRFEHTPSGDGAVSTSSSSFDKKLLKSEKFYVEVNGTKYAATGYNVGLRDTDFYMAHLTDLQIAEIFADAKYADASHLEGLRPKEVHYSQGNIECTLSAPTDIKLYFEELTEVPTEYKLYFDDMEITVA